MCMMQAPINRDNPDYRREKKPEKKHIAFNKALLDPDPSFKDERKRVKKEEKKGFFSDLFGL